MSSSSIIEQGELFNLSFDGKKRVSGWVLLKTVDNKEYILRENTVLTGFKKLKIKREVYTCETSMKNLILPKDEAEKLKKIGQNIVVVLELA